MNVSPYTLDIAISSIWIALGLLFVATGLWFARSRLRPAATLVYAGALLLLAATAFRVHPALVRAPLSDDVTDLQDQLIALRSDRDKWQSAFSTEAHKLASKEFEIRTTVKRVANLEQDIAQLRKHLQTRAIVAAAKSKALAGAQDQLLDATDNLDKTRRALAAKTEELARLKADLSQALEQLKVHAQKIANLEHDIQTGRHELVRVTDDLESERLVRQRELEASRALERRLKAALAEIEKLRSQPEIVKASARLTAVKARLDQSIDAKEFSIAPYDPPGFTKITKGTCYALVVKKRTGASFTFQATQFVLMDDEDEFLEAFSLFNGEFLAELRQLASVVLFVRGKADSGGVIGSLPTAFVRFRKVPYLPFRKAPMEQSARSRSLYRMWRTGICRYFVPHFWQSLYNASTHLQISEFWRA